MRVAIAICAATIASLLASVPVVHASLGFKSVGFSIDSAPPLGAEPGAVGPPQLQAGSHPYQVKIPFAFNLTTDSQGESISDGATKDLQIDLPAGLIGSTPKIPRCRPEEFESSTFFLQGCPSASQVGMMSLNGPLLNATLPVFNLEPPPEQAAQLGVFAVVAPMVMGLSLRTEDDYGLTVKLRNLPQLLSIFGGSLTLWGVPADGRHDTLRGSCLGTGGESLGECASGAPQKPFLTLPGTCGISPQVTLRIDSWERPGEFVSKTAVPRDGKGDPLALHGCDGLDFSPSMDVHPERRVADTPSGFGVDLRLPQSENPAGLGEAEMREAVVALPPGVSINPAAADGLGACLPQQIDLSGPAEPHCPDSSRVGAVTIATPLIAAPFQGAIYLAAPNQNTFASTLAAYMVAEQEGVLIKIAGRIDADPGDGRLTVTLDDLPQLPFSDFELSFDGGPRAPLALPPSCGTFTATGRFASHSGPLDGKALMRSSSFVVDHGCGGGISPSFFGGATGSLAGRRTGLTLRLARSDGEREFRRFSTSLPQGLLPLLGSIPPCPAPQAADGSCDPSSQIGSVAIAAGAGPHPFHLLGKAFLTGPYGGAPFGLSIAVPGVAGPFDLGPIVIRARVSVDPHDAHLSIATDPLPQILRGIPLRIRSFELTSADQPGLFVAPTSCDEQWFSATAFGATGAAASLSSPFFLNGCRGLRFAPQISASTGARVTSSGGAALELEIRSRGGAQANLRAIRVHFPHRLSPRLSAIQAACARATFAADPSSCPAASVIGRATVRTSILDVPLSGPAYLVSRGTEALPRIVLVLGARGVVLDLAGSLRIADDGASVATFASMPDAPISRFALRLPRGPHSALGANFLGAAKGSLCGRKLTMPTQLLAQSGSRLERTVRVAVSGCARSPSGSPRR
jgi:hypothetical protein